MPWRMRHMWLQRPELEEWQVKAAKQLLDNNENVNLRTTTAARLQELLSLHVGPAAADPVVGLCQPQQLSADILVAKTPQAATDRLVYLLRTQNWALKEDGSGCERMPDPEPRSTKQKRKAKKTRR